MTDWPKYRSHKIVQALPIVEITHVMVVGNDDLNRIYIYVEPEGGSREEFVPAVAAMAARANVGDYAVIYEDGYHSISPKKAFEEGCTRV